MSIQLQSNDNGYDTALNSLFQQLQSLHSDSDQARNDVRGRLTNVTSQFVSAFTNMVGREPNQNEINRFLQQSAGSTIANANSGTGRSEADPTGVSNAIQSFIGNNFTKTAQDYAQDQLKQQQQGWLDLANTARTQGTAAINTTQQSLLDYQSKLFDRLRPNLLTSLKAQGLLDTGGLNEAVAGVQGDLANNASNYIAGLTYQNETNANNIALGGQSAPLSYLQSTTTGQPTFLNSLGGTASTFQNNTYMDNLNYQHQLGLVGAQAKAQSDLQPSFLRTLGQSFANNMGQQFAQAGGQLIKPSSYMTSFGG